MPKALRFGIWVLVAALAAVAFGRIALVRGETINAAWLLTAALCSYAIAYRFYSKLIAAKVFALDANRATPAVRLEDGRDFVPTNRWIVFGSHFAAIAGPGPLVGPTLAAQFGYLPGVIWIIVGVALGGAVQDFVILASSVRRDGKSLGQMAREEIGPVAGVTAFVAVLGIMIVLLAVLALIVVNALKSSPWGLVTIGLTIPIAMLMGVYLRWMRPGRVLEASAIGIVLIVFALFAGQWVSNQPSLAAMFTLSGTTRGARRHGVRVRRVGASGVAAARAARLPVGLREDRRGAGARRSASSSRCRRFTCRRSRSSSTAPARCSRARYSRSRSSRSRAERSPASTRSSRPARRPRCSSASPTRA